MDTTLPPTAVRWGDFSSTATYYSQRPPYSRPVLDALIGLVRAQFGSVRLAELGAGTGNLLRSFGDADVSGYAVEPNPEMRAEARRLAPSENRFEWREGTAETSGLSAGSVDWVLLGNAYQFVDPPAMFEESHRILRPGGFLTIIWNIRDFEKDALQRAIEDRVKAMVPQLKRTGSSVAEIMERADSRGLFENWLYVDANHLQTFSPERFLATWQAGHDVPSQVSTEHWQDIVAETRRLIPDKDIETIWRTRAWTLRRR